MSSRAALAAALLVLLGNGLSRSAQAAIQIEVAHSDAADIFEILDNVSQWLRGYNDVEYRDFWLSSGRSKQGDAKLFERYAKIRQKYYVDADQAEKDPLKNRNGFFSTLSFLSADPLAIAFYSSATLEEALHKAKKIVTDEELEFLRGFYKNFADRVAPLVKESAGFAALIEKTERELSPPGISEYLKSVCRFFGVTEDLKYTVRFVWWPPVQRTRANPVGSFLLIKQNPKTHAHLESTDIVMHEVIHSVSALQALESKAKYTAAFLSACPVQQRLTKFEILEEPLAVAIGQMAFLEKFRRGQFRFAQDWYNNTWNSMFGELIFPVVKEYLDQGRQLDDAFAKQTGLLCSQVVQVAEKLSPRAAP